MIQQKIGAWFSQLRVGQKISFGYGAALGLAVSGTIAGFLISHHYHQKALEAEAHTRTEVELLHRVQTTILQIRTHQQQLLPLLKQPDAFQEEYEHIRQHAQHLRKDWSALKQFSKASIGQGSEFHSVRVPQFLKAYDSASEQYLEALERQVTAILQSPSSAPSFQKTLLTFTNSEIALKFDEVSDELTELIDKAYQENAEADAMVIQSTEISKRIILTGFGLSIAVSIFLAVLTSQAISKPIRALTNVAKRSTEESNFELQAIVTNQDEIGTLATAFNRLIESVQQLLQEQQMHRQTLEQNVETRTLELREKNERLQELLDELNRTQLQMVQAEKMSALGQMVAGVAHEINNPVNFIHGNLTHVQQYAQDLLSLMQAYQDQYPNPPRSLQSQIDEIDLDFLMQDMLQILQSMNIGTQRIREIVLSLRNFSRLDESGCKAVDLHEGLDNTLMILQHRLKGKGERQEIQVIREYGQLPLVQCFAGQLNQVFMNLLANAIDALEDSEDPRIWIWTKQVDDDRVQLAIADNGSGIPKEVCSRLFDPFFTTKPVGKGTGLGLSISHQIVTEKHSGSLACDSTPGEGTKFIVELPLSHNG